MSYITWDVGTSLDCVHPLSKPFIKQPSIEKLAFIEKTSLLPYPTCTTLLGTVSTYYFQRVLAGIKIYFIGLFPKMSSFQQNSFNDNPLILKWKKNKKNGDSNIPTHNVALNTFHVPTVRAFVTPVLAHFNECKFNKLGFELGVNFAGLLCV